MTVPPAAAPTATWASAATADRHDSRPQARASLLEAVTDLRRDVAGTRFPLPLPGVEVAEARRRQLLDQLDDHLLPRLRELSAPAVVVVAGSTGAGKSTVVNSLLGAEVSAAGVLRPTTRRPVLAHHPDDADLLRLHPLLDIVDVVEHRAVPRGIALVDAPDLDSLVVTNRSTAHRLLEAADLWLFVTTAARYGDALPWEVLEEAAGRGTSMAMVLNRVPGEALVTVRGELMQRMRARGMAAVPLFLIHDAGPHEGLLEAGAVAPILRWLTMVAGPDRARAVIARTQRGSLAALRPWVDDLAEAVQAQVDARQALELVVRSAIEAPLARAADAASAGAVADGPVQARWTALTAKGGPLAGRWTSRWGRSARIQAVDELAATVRSAVTVALTHARQSGSDAAAEALASTDVVGAGGVLQALELLGDQPRTATASVSPADSAAEWMAGAVQLVHHLADQRPGRGAAALARAVGENGVAGLVAAAAVGVDGARAGLSAALGAETAAQVVGLGSAELASRVRTQVEGGAAAALDVLASSDLADDAASRLLLRRAVLKDLA